MRPPLPTPVLDILGHVGVGTRVTVFVLACLAVAVMLVPLFIAAVTS